MLQNAYLVAKIGADTAENERNFAKNWHLPYGSSDIVPRGRRRHDAAPGAKSCAYCKLRDFSGRVSNLYPQISHCRHLGGTNEKTKFNADTHVDFKTETWSPLEDESSVLSWRQTLYV